MTTDLFDLAQISAVVFCLWETKFYSLTCVPHVELLSELEFGFLRVILPLTVQSGAAISGATERELGVAVQQ